MKRSSFPVMVVLLACLAACNPEPGSQPAATTAPAATASPAATEPSPSLTSPDGDQLESEVADAVEDELETELRKLEEANRMAVEAIRESSPDGYPDFTDEDIIRLSGAACDHMDASPEELEQVVPELRNADEERTIEILSIMGVGGMIYCPTE